MTPEIKRALETIRDECQQHVNCNRRCELFNLSYESRNGESPCRISERTPEEERKTMSEYIDKEAMLEQIARREPLMVGDKMISIDALREFIMNRPIADVEEVKHGHWIYYPECGVTKCSVCHRSVEECVEYPRCMFCGAKIDEEVK